MCAQQRNPISRVCRMIYIVCIYFLVALMIFSLSTSYIYTRLYIWQTVLCAIYIINLVSTRSGNREVPLFANVIHNLVVVAFVLYSCYQQAQGLFVHDQGHFVIFILPVHLCCPPSISILPLSLSEITPTLPHSQFISLISFYLFSLSPFFSLFLLLTIASIHISFSLCGCLVYLFHCINYNFQLCYSYFSTFSMSHYI